LPPAETKTVSSGEKARSRSNSPWPKVEKSESLEAVLTSIWGETGVEEAGIGVGGIAVGGIAVGGTEVLVGTAVWVDVAAIMVSVGAVDSTAGNSFRGEQADNKISATSIGMTVFIIHSLAMELTRP
jgi:hypothetical protein